MSMCNQHESWGQSKTTNDTGPTTKTAAKEGPIVNEDLFKKEDKGERPIGDRKHSGDRGAKTGEKREQVCVNLERLNTEVKGA